MKPTCYGDYCRTTATHPPGSDIVLILFLTLFMLAFIGAAWHAWQLGNVASYGPSLDERTVLLEDAEGSGTGIILDGRHILTAGHSLSPTFPPIKVTSNKTGIKYIADAKIVDARHDLGLVVLKAPMAGYPPLPIRCAPLELREELTGIAHVAELGERFLAPFMVTALTDQLTDEMLTENGLWHPYVMVSGSIIPGMSGGPVADKDGLLSGIMVMTKVYALMGVAGWEQIPQPFGFLSPSEHICRFLDLHAPGSYVRADAPSAGSIDWRRAFGLAPKGERMPE